MEQCQVEPSCPPSPHVHGEGELLEWQEQRKVHEWMAECRNPSLGNPEVLLGEGLVMEVPRWMVDPQKIPQRASEMGRSISIAVPPDTNNQAGSAIPQELKDPHRRHRTDQTGDSAVETSGMKHTEPPSPGAGGGKQPPATSTVSGETDAERRAAAEGEG